MLLGIKDRYVLLRTLPTEGNFRTMRTIVKLREDLLPSEDEIKSFGIKMSPDGNTVVWDVEKATESDIQIGEVATEVIVAALKNLDSQDKLTIDHMPMWERFIEEK
jgi:predicted aconitase